MPWHTSDIRQTAKLNSASLFCGLLDPMFRSGRELPFIHGAAMGPPVAISDWLADTLSRSCFQLTVQQAPWSMDEMELRYTVQSMVGIALRAGGVNMIISDGE